MQMSFEKWITFVNLFLLCANLCIAYFGLRLNRKKDFQDTLYKFKIEAYKTIVDECYTAYGDLNVNAHPFVTVYDYEDTAEWKTKFQSEITQLFSVGFGLQKLVYRNSAFLPPEIVDQLHNYSEECLSFVTKASNGDTAIMVEQQDKLWDLLIELINAIRKDLKTDIIDATLASRIHGRL